MDKAGVILGSFSLLIQVIEKWPALTNRWRRFKQPKEIMAKLKVFVERERGNFVRETYALLKIIIEPEQAKSMVTDSECSLYKDRMIRRQVHEALGDNRQDFSDAVIDVLQQLNRLMNESEQNYESFDERIMFSFMEAKLQEMSNSLRKSTEHYRYICTNISETLAPKSTFETNYKMGYIDLSREYVIRTAAKHVYHALMDACTEHDEHYVHIPLTPHVESDTNVKFQMAVRSQLQQRSSTWCSDPLWFIIAVADSTDMTQPLLPISVRRAVLDNQTPSDRQISPFEAIQAIAAFTNKSVRSNPVLPSASTSASGSAFASPQHSQPMMPPSYITKAPDISTRAAFCQMLRKSRTQGDVDETCIGRFLNEPPWEHSIYLPSSQYRHGGRTLTEVLPLKKNSDEGAPPLLSRHRRLQLAQLLSKAVLNYHSTPWLQSPLRSDNIILYNIENGASQTSSPGAREPDAFIEVPISKTIYTQSQQLADPSIRNPILFGLGVILIELAFCKPLQTMIEGRDSRLGISPAETERTAVFRLSGKLRSTDMSDAYTTVVEKCLLCNFGSGVSINLGDPDLQRAVYRDVVSELDVMV